MKNNHEVALSAHNIGVCYKGHGRALSGDGYWAFKGLSFEAYRGETLGIIGRNGVGKSSLLRVLAGIVSPDVGHMDSYGNSVSLLALRVGFLGYLSGRENAVLSGMLQGLRRREAEAKLEEIIEFSGLAEFIDNPVGTYSTGMAARLGFSVAMHAKSDVLLIDEALGVGDEEFKKKSTAAMKHIIASDRTVVFVSHAIPVVKELCDRVLWIESGEVKMMGETNSVLRAYIASINASKAKSVSKA